MIAPIAVRELLVASRRSLSWRIRLLMTLCALLIASLALVSVRSASAVGIEIFNVLCFISFLYALSAGILFTADSITAERREGTFGLLYLTPLSSWNVVSGKLLSTSLQGIYGLVATVPVLSLSLLGGGVTGELVLRMVLLLLATLLLSLLPGSSHRHPLGRALPRSDSLSC
jgi:ABC-type transport system involved in multi-copper enzyme maturation permease subunit